jgi:hypothetical protein
MSRSGRAPRTAFHDQAAHVIRLLVDIVDLVGNVGYVLLGNHCIAGGLVKLNRDANRVSFAAVEQQPMLGMSRVNSDQQRVVTPRFSQDFRGDGHGFVFPASTAVQR